MGRVFHHYYTVGFSIRRYPCGACLLFAASSCVFTDADRLRRPGHRSSHTKDTRLPDPKDIPIFLLCGFFGFAVYHVGINVGEQTVSAGLSSLIVTLAPVFTAIWSVLFLKERMTVTGLLGTVISFLGVALISISIDGSFRFTVQTLIILLAAFSESIYFVVQAPYLKKYDSIAFTTYTIWAAALFMVLHIPGGRAGDRRRAHKVPA
jgi:drug/metabolite transporter (DMT)-like permease